MRASGEGDRFTIMIVNDSSFIVDVLAAMLERRGHKVIPAYDSIEALERLKRERPDLILTNIMRDGIDGWEFTELVKSDPETMGIPVVITSAKMYTEKERQKYSHLIEEYIHLPVTHHEMCAIVERVMENYRSKTGRR